LPVFLKSGKTVYRFPKKSEKILANLEVVPLIELLKELILDFQSQDLETGVKRHLAYELVKGRAFVCIGVR